MSRKSSIYKSVNVPSLVDKVVRELREAIIFDQLKPGMHLAENDLSRKLAVSRSPIREALKILEKEGFINIIPRRGAFVAGISLKELTDIYIIRASLERLSGRLGVPNLKKKDLARMENLLQQMSDKTLKGDIKGVFRLNEKFHDVLFVASGNERLIQIAQGLRIQIQRFRMASISVPGRLEEALREHEKIMECCRRKDADAAANLLEEHVLHAGLRLKDSLMVEKGLVNGKNKSGIMYGL